MDEPPLRLNDEKARRRRQRNMLPRPDVKALIKRMAIADFNLSVNQIHQHLQKRDIRLSEIAISGIVREFRLDQHYCFCGIVVSGMRT